MKKVNRQTKTRNSALIAQHSVLCAALCVMLLALSFSAQAQQPKKISRIGYLSAWDAASESSRAEGVRLALLELGYVEGQNIAVEYRYAEANRDRYPELAAELVRLKVDVIVVAGGFIPIQAVKNATKTIPISRRSSSWSSI